MIDLSCQYLKMDLKNPLIISSNPLTGKLDLIKKCEDNGAGAVVLKSLFEEQINANVNHLANNEGFHIHPEAMDYIQGMESLHDLEKYQKLITTVKSAVSIPVIASINAVSADWWISRVPGIEAAGADAIELNLAIIPDHIEKTGEQIEKYYIKTVQEVKKKTKMPIAVKIGPYFTSLLNLSQQLVRSGADALVLFNRFYQIDIDIKHLKLTHKMNLSHADELSLPLRWIAKLYEQINCPLAASTGIHNGKSMIKALLAGAAAVQICTTLYVNGYNVIQQMLNDLENWMAQNKFENLEQFRGMLSQARIQNPAHYDRLQYIKMLNEYLDKSE